MTYTAVSRSAENGVWKKARKINTLKVTNLNMMMISWFHEEKIRLCNCETTPKRIAECYYPTCSNNKAFELHTVDYETVFLLRFVFNRKRIWRNSYEVDNYRSKKTHLTVADQFSRSHIPPF